MKIKWNEQEVKWFHAASEYTTYNKELADLIVERAKTGGTLCDIGCGAALVDMEMTEQFSHITCVDIGEKAIESVKSDMKKLHISNMTAICQDGETIDGKWDTVLTVFHGGSDIWGKYFKHAKDRMIIVTHDKKCDRFGQKEKHDYFYNVSGTKAELDEKGVIYDMTEVELEHGQPFENREDAKNFFAHYVKFDSEEETETYMEEHLVETGDEKYPYYLPKNKKFGIFVIRRADNERFE